MIAGVVAVSVTAAGCCMPVSASESGAESAAAAAAADDYPIDLFDDYVESVEDPVISEPDAPTDPDTLPPAGAAGRFTGVASGQDLLNILMAPHDNAAYGKPENLSDYVGQLLLTNFAYCVSSETGVEDLTESRLRLDKKLVRRDFSYDPGVVDVTHEYFNKDGDFLFSIKEIDNVDGVSVGKIRLCTAPSDTGIDFYYDDYDIGAVIEYETLSEVEKAAIGSRKEVMSEDLKARNSQNNQAVYGRRAKTIEEFIGPEKWNAVAGVLLYSPENPLADAEGYIKGSLNCLFVRNLLDQKYIRKWHAYRLNNDKHYLRFVDADGNHLFGMNTSPESNGVDLYRKGWTIERGYSNGTILQMYPEYLDIPAEIEKEEELVMEKRLQEGAEQVPDVSAEQ